MEKKGFLTPRPHLVYSRLPLGWLALGSAITKPVLVAVNKHHAPTAWPL